MTFLHKFYNSYASRLPSDISPFSGPQEPLSTWTNNPTYFLPPQNPLKLRSFSGVKSAVPSKLLFSHVPKLHRSIRISPQTVFLVYFELAAANSIKKWNNLTLISLENLKKYWFAQIE